ncbi:MAG: HNH endonuclease family protein, partial [Bacteroidales bacterium]
NIQAKGVLYLLELSTRSHLNSTKLLSFAEYSLEHVMPKKWRNNWGEVGLSKEQADLRDDLLLTLGNLTVITGQLNSAIRDSDWNTKLNGNGKHLGLMTYSQGIEIFSKYFQRVAWNEDCIKERAQELFDLSVNKTWNQNLI